MISALANRLTLVLLLLCSGLGAMIAWELHVIAATQEALPDSSQASDDSPPAVQTLPNALSVSLPATALQAYREILERPLFIRGREPPAKPQAAAVSEQATPLRYLLEGVALSRDKRVALLRDPGSREQVSLEEGDEWQGWRVEQVLPDRVILSGDGQIRELLLEPEDTQAQAPGSAANRRKP